MNVSFDPRAKAKNYERAREYLNLKYPAEISDVLVEKLRNAPVTWHKPSDIFRATHTEPYPLSDQSVQHVAHKIAAGHNPEPILMTTVQGHTEIADGAHHASLLYHLLPHKRIPVQSVDLNARAL